MRTEPARAPTTFPIIAFAAAAVLLAFVSVHDYVTHEPGWEIFLDLVCMVVAVFGIRWMWRQWADAKRISDGAVALDEAVRAPTAGPVAVLATTAALLAVVAAHDLSARAPAWEVVLDIACMVVVIQGIWWMWRQWADRPPNDAAEAPADDSVPSPTMFPLISFAVTAALLGFDIIHDMIRRAATWEIMLEFGVVVFAVQGVRWLWRQWEAERRAAATARSALTAARAEATEWRTEAERWRRETADSLQGLSVIIERQFERWNFTPAEREVAHLLLKGLSHKEAAAVRGASERTVRQQALAIYQKSGLSGRAELSAFFMEDLLPPQPGKESRP